MSLHIFIKGNIYDYDDIENSHDTLLKISNDCSAQTQVDVARQYWRYKDKEQKIAVLTNSQFFIREISNLILLSKLSLEIRSEICQEYEVYKDLSFFYEDCKKITCYDLECKEECKLEESGFIVKTFNNVIDFQNKIYDYIKWSD